MLAAGAQAIGERISDGDVVLDIGGWASPFPRADWVMDILPHESRGLYGDRRGEPERFDPERWIQRDICDRDPYPFDDDAIDFAICSQTLEDVRDPVWVCAEMSRVARAGYVEVPSRVAEQTFGFTGPWAGWPHHRWLVDWEQGELVFGIKSAVVHVRPEYQLPHEAYGVLRESERVLSIFWEGSIPARERIFVGPGSMDSYLRSLVEAERERLGGRLRAAAPRSRARRLLGAARRRIGGSGRG